MIASIDMAGVKYTIDDITKEYAILKIGGLDRYLPRHARKSVTADIKLKLVKSDNGDNYEAEATLNVPDRVLTAKDSTSSMLAAIDIVEAKLLAQLHKYKDARIMHITHRRLFSRDK